MLSIVLKIEPPTPLSVTFAKLQVHAATGQQQEEKVATKETLPGKSVCKRYQDEAGDYYEGRPVTNSFCYYGICTFSRDLPVWVPLHQVGTDRPGGQEERGVQLWDGGVGCRGGGQV